MGSIPRQVMEDPRDCMGFIFDLTFLLCVWCVRVMQCAFCISIYLFGASLTADGMFDEMMSVAAYQHGSMSRQRPISRMSAFVYCCPTDTARETTSAAFCSASSNRWAYLAVVCVCE